MIILREMAMILGRTSCSLSLIIYRTWAFSSWLCAIGHVIVFLYVTETKDHSNLYCLRGKLKQSDVYSWFFFPGFEDEAARIQVVSTATWRLTPAGSVNGKKSFRVFVLMDKY